MGCAHEDAHGETQRCPVCGKVHTAQGRQKHSLVTTLLLLQSGAYRREGPLSSIDNIQMQLLISDPCNPEEEPPVSACVGVSMPTAAAHAC